MTRSLPDPRSSWLINMHTGAVVEILLGEAPSRPFLDKRRQARAATRCGACNQHGHNARNKKCPKWAP